MNEFIDEFMRDNYRFDFSCNCEDCLWCDKCDKLLAEDDNCFEDMDCWAETVDVWVEMSYYKYGEIKLYGI